jgi:hypothetical protein
VAQEGMIAIEYNVSNAFAEATSIPRMVENHLGNPLIPKECNVVQVCYARQGHPESACLWEKHIDKILHKYGMKPTIHQPCLYSGHINNHKVLFLWQVDDFAVATISTDAAENLIDMINQKMRIPVKHLGIINRFNGIDIQHTHCFIKLTCEQYLCKMLHNHGWLQDHNTIMPLPFPADANYIKELETVPL